MEAKKIANNEAGELSAVTIDGRAFVHGSILDNECARRDAEIERLRAALKEIAEWPVHEDENGLRYNGPQWIAQRALEQSPPK